MSRDYFLIALTCACLVLFFLMTRRPPRSPLDRSAAASDVYKRQPYAYGHGYQYPAGGWRTIMAYACSTGTCNRINYWSNPAKLRSGVPMGTTTRSHNQRVLNNTKATIAAFR